MSRRVVGLAVLLALLGAIDLILVVRDAREAQRAAAPGGPIVRFEAAGIRRVSVSRKEKRVVLERAPGGWVIASARRFPARGQSVDGMLERILSWRRDRAGGSASVDAFKVDDANALHVRLEAFDGLATELVLGGVTGLDPEIARAKGGQLDPGSLGRFVRLLPEDTAWVVNDFVTGELEPDQARWLERPLPGGGADKVRAFTLAPRGQTPFAVVLDGPYPRVGPAEVPADPDRARVLAAELVGVRGLSVWGLDEEPPGLSAPALSAEVLFADGRAPLRLVLGDAVAPETSGSPPGRAARLSGLPPVVLEESSVVSLLGARADTVVLRSLLGVRGTSGLVRAELTGGPRPLVFAPSVGSPESPEAARVRAALGALGITGYGREETSSRPAGLTLRVERDGVAPLLLELGEDSARLRDLPWRFTVGASALRELEAAFAGLSR